MNKKNEYSGEVGERSAASAGEADTGRALSCGVLFAEVVDRLRGASGVDTLDEPEL